MPNQLHLSVDNPDELRNAGAYDTGAIIRVQWSATEAGAFVDVSGTGSTPTIPIVVATRSYTGYDPAGTSSTFYRTRYENAGATRVSDWTAAFQVGAEEAGQLCSLYDVKQRLFPSASAGTAHVDDESLLEFITAASSDIQSYTGRRFARSPSSGETTFYFDVTRGGRELRVPAGIASMSVLEVATQSQPASGGTYTTVSTAEWFLRPLFAERDFGWPATRVVISDISGSYFYPGLNTVRATMALGFTAIPPEIKAMAERYVVKAYQGKGSGVVTALGGGDFEGRLINFLSPEDMRKLDWYSVQKAA